MINAFAVLQLTSKPPSSMSDFAFPQPLTAT
jgi:hypothetical protein